MPTDIGPKIGLQGEGEFRRSIADANSALKTLGSEMKLVAAQFEGQEKSEEALIKQNEVLGKNIEALSSKAELLKTRMAELRDRGVAETDKRYQDLQRQLNLTEAEMVKNQHTVEANEKAMQELGQATEEEGDAAEEAAEKNNKLGSVLEGVGKVAAAMVAAVTAAVGAVAKLTLDAAKAADEINTLSKTTGLSTTEIQRLQYASGVVDVSLDTLTGSMTKLTSTMSSASKGSGDAYEAFRQLGIEVTNQDGTLRDRNEVFNEAIEALGKIEDETNRDAVAMKIFGKSAKDLNPLILGGAEALKELGDQAEASGLILSQDSLDKLNSVSDAMDTFKATTEAAGRVAVVGFAEPLSEAINTATGYVTRLVQAFNEDGFAGLGEAFGEVLTGISADIVDYLPEVTAFGVEIVNTLATGLISMLPSIVQAGSEVVLTLATGISDLLPELIPVAVDAILTLVDTLIRNADQMIDAALKIITALTLGVINAIPVLIEKAPMIIESLVTTLIMLAPQLGVAALQMIISLANGILNNLPKIGAAAGSIVSTFIRGITDLKDKFVRIGGSIVDGVWSGIKSMYENFKANVLGFFSGIVDSVKKALGIHSPSTVFAGIGSNMALGLGEGFSDAITGVERDMAALMPGMNGSVNVTGSASASGGSGTDGGALISAVSAALSGAAVYMDGRKVGELVVGYYDSAARRGLVRV